jgi:ribosomal protein S12 methylthiotransferase accessory factor
MRDIDMHSGSAAALLKALAARHGAALAEGARLPKRLFLIGSPWAPGLAFVGGEADTQRLPEPPTPATTFSLAGSGERIEDALASCIGECAERLSQVERPGDAVRECTLAEARSEAMPAAVALIERLHRAPDAAPMDAAPMPAAWVRARALSTGGDCLVPADWCLRRRRPGPLALPGAALSTGCAAGTSFEAAAARALLELVERDAASLWWIGGRRPRPVAADSAAMAEATRLLAGLRQHSRERATWLLDIAGDLDIPALAAVSVDGDGKGLACGLAARLSAQEAARAAVFEMCQMELALPVVEMKRRQRGDAGLNATDRRHLARATGVGAGSCELLHPLGVPRRDALPDGSVEPLAVLREVFARAGLEAALVDLTRSEIGIPVAWALAPGLQLMPCDLHVDRLQRAIAATGGGERLTGGVALF